MLKLISFAFGFFILLSTTSVYAQTPAASITASPAELQLEVAARQPQQSKEVTLTNSYDTTVSINAELRAIDESSDLLIPTTALREDLANALTLSETNIVIPAKSSKTIKVNGRNLDSLGPGGHYATLLITQRSSDEQKLSLRSAISIKIFFIKADGAIQNIALDKYQASSWLFHIASRADVTFTNKGNVRTTPYGLIYINDRRGNLVSQGLINKGAQPLMPGKSVASNVDLTRIQRVWYPQKLTMTISYRADNLEATSQTQSFWYIPPFYLALPLLFILTLFIFIKRHRKQNTSKPNAQLKDDMPKILKIAIRLHDSNPEPVTVRKKRKRLIR